MKTNPIARFGAKVARAAQAVIPDPFVIAILLSLVAIAIAALTQGSFTKTVVQFSEGMLAKGLIAFAFQMALILVTGHALAEARIVKRGLLKIAAIPKNNAQAAALVAFASMSLGLLNWGLALVAGAILARSVGQRFKRENIALNYPLIGAAGFTGLLVWHGGLSASAALKVAKASSFGDAISISETLFSPLNIVSNLLVLSAVTFCFFMLAKDERNDCSQVPSLEEDAPDIEAKGFAQRLQNARFVSVAFALVLGAAMILLTVERGAKVVTLNVVIILFLLLGLLLHKSPAAYVRAFSEGAKGASGILLQFPLYFGILAVLRESGALTSLSSGLSALANNGVLSSDVSASWLTFLSAAFVNVLIPSGGGQWALQSPVIAESANALMLSRAKLVMAFSYGDQLTNMMQPFWALPLLSITGLKARELMGYTIVVMGVAGLVFLFTLAVF